MYSEIASKHICNLNIYLEVLTSWCLLCRLFTWKLQLSCFKRVSFNELPPPNKRPPSRPLYHKSAPSKKRPTPLPLTFLNSRGIYKETQLQFYCHFIFNFLGVDFSGISMGEYNVVSLPLSHF